MSSRRLSLFALTRGFRGAYAGAVAALLCGTFLSFQVPLVARSAIDRVAASGTASDGLRRELAWAGAAVIALTALAGMFAYLRGRLAATASEGIARRLRDHLYDHLQRLPCAYHDRADSGDLVQRCTSDVETVRLFLAVQVVEIGRAAILTLGVLPLMLRLDPRMTLVALGVFPLVITFAVVFFRRIQTTFRRADEAEGEMTSLLHESLTGIRVVRAFARQGFEEERFAARNRRFRDSSHRLMHVLAVYWSSADLLCLSQIGLLVLVGASRVREGTLSVGTLYAFISYVYLLMQPLRHLGRVLSDAGKAVVSLERLGDVLAVEPEREIEATAAPALLPEPVRGAIRIRGLRFGHGGGAHVLQGLDLDVAAGETLAVLGPPGAGKSTLIHLLLRLYDHDAGSIQLDGVDLHRLERSTARRHIGAVLQEPFLFSRTLGDNLRIGRHGASDEELVDSARVACVHEAIVSFEHGYDTLVGERGVTLSGGQRQRMALARTLLRDPAVLILDDALSAIDTSTEARIRAALVQRRGRRTTIIVAHRLATLVAADRVVVLDHGRVVQEGRHVELIDIEGPYRRLWGIQQQLEDEIRRDLAGAARPA